MITLIKKLTILSVREIKEPIISALHDLGLLHVEAIRSTDDEESEHISFGVIPEEADDVDTKLSRVRSLLGLFKRYEPPAQTPFIDSLIGIKTFLDVDQEEFAQVVSSGENIIAGAEVEAREVEGKLSHLREEIGRRQQMLERLKGFEALQLRLEHLTDTPHTRVLLITCLQNNVESLLQGLRTVAEETGGAVHTEDIGTKGVERLFLVVYHKSADEKAREVLNRYAKEARLPHAKGTPSEVVERLGTEIRDLKDQIKKAEGSFLERVASSKPKLQMLYDALSLRKQGLDVERNLAQSRNLFVITGWAKADDVPKIRSVLDEVAEGKVEVRAVDPDPKDNVPVVLDNDERVSPFELVQELYGLPTYREVDPTPLIMPFFAVFFGFCLTDAGYGIILILLSSYFIFIKGLTGSARKLMYVLMAGGFFGIVAGALVGGSWLGNIFTSPKEYPSLYVPILSRFSLFDPLAEPMKFLYLTIAFGIVHLMSGILFAAYKNIHKGRWSDALMDDLPWLMLLTGIVAYALIDAGTIGKEYLMVSNILIGLGVIIIVLFFGRNFKNPIQRLGVGLIGLYGLVGYLGDVLSYTRILALGLASAVIANVVDALSVMVVTSFGALGLIVAIPLFIIGHLVNVILSALSGFIHTARLHYVEWFGKFLEGGGHRFSPFKKEVQYLRINQGSGLNV
ncbi:MAG: V-type ATP synthase subunit I [Methanopyri archaeon]|jgi:V/A-type H+-transporting ATPase subunit I|nr:V-type ATP synthase subunit I [Methanopyri archaeon]